MNEHTRGPWKVIERKIPFSLADGRTDEHVERWIYTAWHHPQSKGPYPVVTLSTGLGMHGDPAVRMVHISEADARLIAAAPDLLRALKLADAYLCGEPSPEDLRGGDIADIVSAAIAKAEGES